MGGFSVWHWLIVIIMISLPLIFALQSPPAGPNRYGPPSEPVNFAQAVARFFQNYANFKGRATRSEFWYSVLFTVPTSLVFTFVEKSGVLSTLFGLAVLTPNLAINCRRLHDINRSGWHQLLNFVIPFGPIMLIAWFAKAGTDGNYEVPVTTASARPLNTSSIEMIERLSKLKADGAITDAEYEAQKRRILG